MKQHTNNFLRKLFQILFFCLGVYIIIVGIRFGMKELEIKEILISGDAVQIEIDKKIFVGNIFLFPTAQMELQILRANPLLKSVSIRKVYPHTIHILFEKRLQQLTLQTRAGSFGIDIDGVVVGDASNISSFPIIKSPETTVTIGKKINDAFVYACLLFYKHAGSIVRPSYFMKYDSTSIQVKSDIANIFIVQKADMQSIATTLQALVEGFRIKGIAPKTIDLRFDKPTITL